VVAIVWRRIAQSVRGSSHAGEDSPCQDSHGLRLLLSGPAETLVACVADGAGSAKFSDLGSEIACSAILEFIASYRETVGSFDELSAEDVLHWCEEIRRRIQSDANMRGCTPRDLATTLCVAIVGPTSSCFFQIGDGAIIAGHHGLYGVIFWPQSGEFANSTNFITSNEYRERLEFLSAKTRFTDVALFTDGLERLALRFDVQTPHVPFFQPLFQVLRTSADEQGLNEGLRKFLSSDTVQNRSDDDKTLILATRSADHLSGAV
jgi:serine/threonine protein phosphatase PrpC